MPVAFTAFVLAAAMSTGGSPAARKQPAPEPIIPLERLVSPDDYPADALKALDEGAVRIRIEVDEKGAVSDCVIQQSSGVSSLDSQTCRLIWQRAKFKPAVDPSGRPVRSTIEKTYVWRLEQGQPGPSEAWAIRKIIRYAVGKATECRMEYEGAVRGMPNLPECQDDDTEATEFQRLATSEGAVEFVEERRFTVEQQAVLQMAPGDRLIASMTAQLDVDATGEVTKCTVIDERGFIPPGFPSACALAGKRFVARRGPGGGKAKFTAYFLVGAYLHFERVT